MKIHRTLFKKQCRIRRVLPPISCFAMILLLVSGTFAQRRPIQVPALKLQDSVRSSGIDAGDYIYISGQGPNREDGSMPADFEAQATQALENVKAIVLAAGLTMDHVVYVQVYLEDVKNYQSLNAVFAKYFPHTPPARAILGVARLAQPAIEITAVAVRELSERRAVIPANYKTAEPYSPGILTQDRLFVSAMQGRDPQSGAVPDDPAAQVNLALEGLKAVVEAAGLKLSNMVFVNPYLTQKIPMERMNEEYARRFEFGHTPAGPHRRPRPAWQRTKRIHRCRGARFESSAFHPSEKYAPQSHRQPLRFCRRNSVLLRQKWVHPWAARRRLCRVHCRATSSDDAKPT